VGLRSHLLSLVDDILEFSRIEVQNEPISLTNFDVVLLIREIVSSARSLADKKDVLLTQSFDSPIIQIKANRRAVQQILFNLVDNAVKFTDRDGRVLVVVAEREKNLVISISDTGRGMSPQLINELGKPFVQASSSEARDHSGTGLGIAICKALAALMNFRLVFESELGVGTKASLVIPSFVMRGDAVELPEIISTVTQG
jgi:cell cycle sensor histidine kinase DivJ